MSVFFSYDLEGLEENGVELKFKCVRMQKMSDGNIRAIRVFNTDFSEHDKVFEDKIHELKKELSKMKQSQDNYFKLLDKYREQNEELTIENKELKQRISELESMEMETCKNEPKISDSAPGMEWYENRHQSDCIEINRLNTTIDVLIHKVEYLRQFAGLE